MTSSFVRYQLQRGDGGQSQEGQKRSGGLILAEFERDPRFKGWRRPLEIRLVREEVKDEEPLEEKPKWQTRGLVQQYRRQDVWLVRETEAAVAKAPHLGAEAKQFVGRPKAQGSFNEQFFVFKIQRAAKNADDAAGDAEQEGRISVLPVQDWLLFRASRSQRELQQSLEEIDDKQKQRRIQERQRQSMRKSRLAALLKKSVDEEGGEEEDLEDNIANDIAYRHQGDVIKLLRERKMLETVGQDPSKGSRHDRVDLAIEDRENGGQRAKGFVDDDGDEGDYGEDGTDFKPVYLGSDDEVQNADEEGIADETLDPEDDPFAFQAEEEEAEEEPEAVEQDEEQASSANGQIAEPEVPATPTGPNPRKRAAEDDVGAEEEKSTKRSRVEKKQDGSPYRIDPNTGYREISRDSVIDALREYGQFHSGVTKEEFLLPFAAEIDAARVEGDLAKAKFIAKRIHRFVKEVTDKMKHPTKGAVYKLKAQYF